MKSLIWSSEFLQTPPLWVRAAAMTLMASTSSLFLLGSVTWFGYAPRHPELFTPFSFSVEESAFLFRRIGLSMQGWLTLHWVSGLFKASVYSAVGVLIFIRKKDWFGLYIALVLVLYGTITGTPVFIMGKQMPWIATLTQPLSVLTWASWFFLFYLFPNGRFAPSWARWFALTLLLGFVIDVIVYGGSSPPPWLVVIMLPGLLMAFISQVYRYRNVASAVERQQIKLIVFSILVLIGPLSRWLLVLLFPEWMDITSPGAVLFPIYSLVSEFLLLMFPLTIGFAMLRYRLWDIDLVIRRTLQYSLLTGVLALIYYGSVFLLQSLTENIFGEQSPLIIVLSTLAIAALFNPLRDRIQDFIDRRFYRKKYDAEQSLTRFAATARDEVDMDLLAGALLEVIEETMQPEQVSFWMVPQHEKRKTL